MSAALLHTASPASVVTVTSEMARQLAVEVRVCVRPLVRRVMDQATGDESTVALPCGSTREGVCPSCADKARRLRIQQCAEGWHRTNEPGTSESPAELEPHADIAEDPDCVVLEDGAGPGERRVRSTRRREDASDLPRVAVEDRTVGRVFVTPEGREYRPSLFLTLTLPSYGKVRDGVPLDPDRYQYRRAALDALHFPKLVDRFWQNLRRCAGYRVQYFAAVEPQHRLAPHLHAAVRGVVPRAVIREVVRATYVQVWWPSFERAVYVQRVPVWDGSDYIDLDTGLVLPTWDEAVEAAAEDCRAAHAMRFGAQLDVAGIIAPSPDADRAVRYLTKYLAKSVAATFVDPEYSNPAYEAHVDRLHAEVRLLPCSEQCANWLRYGVQPKGAGRGQGQGDVRRGRTTERTWAWVVAGCWCRGSGRARRCGSTRPTGRRWCGRRC